MFLKVKMKDLSLVINLGTDLSQANSLVEMFEKNAVVVEENYGYVKVLDEVKSTIELGDKLTFEKSGYSGEESNVIITSNTDVIGCVNADANAYIDLTEVNKKHKTQLDKLKQELEMLSASNKVLNTRVEELENILETE